MKLRILFHGPSLISSMFAAVFLLVFLVSSIHIVYCIPCYETVSSWATLFSALLDQNVEQYWLTRMGVKCQASQYKDPTKDGNLLALPIQDTVRLLLHICWVELEKITKSLQLLSYWTDVIFIFQCMQQMEQEMACCLMASSHYLNHCWFVMHAQESNFIGCAWLFNP